MLLRIIFIILVFTSTANAYTKHELMLRLSVADKYIKQEQWLSAIEAIDQILGNNDDYFIDDIKYNIEFGIKYKASLLLEKVPNRAYEEHMGHLAKKLLTKASQSGDVDTIKRVSSQYHFTQAGYDATLLLMLNAVDHGVDTGIYFHELGKLPDRLSQYKIGTWWWSLGKYDYIFGDSKLNQLLVFKQWVAQKLFGGNYDFELSTNNRYVCVTHVVYYSGDEPNVLIFLDKHSHKELWRISDVDYSFIKSCFYDNYLYVIVDTITDIELWQISYTGKVLHKYIISNNPLTIDFGWISAIPMCKGGMIVSVLPDMVIVFNTVMNRLEFRIVDRSTPHHDILWIKPVSGVININDRWYLIQSYSSQQYLINVRTSKVYKFKSIIIRAFFRIGSYYAIKKM